MSWFSSSPSIDELVERATSENLPTGEQDIGLNLEICDMIRSKAVPAKDAMRSLKRRLLHKNPNVRIAALHLIDTTIKNGGSHYLVEIASREFMDTLLLIVKPPSGVVNNDVRLLALEYIQSWAQAFEGQMQLSYVNKVYNDLRSEGFQFPEPRAKYGASFIDTSAPPEWMDSDTCMKSGTPFSFVNRKHHCRNCGGVYIQQYCQNYLPLPHFGINEPVRVCDDCYGKLTYKARKGSFGSVVKPSTTIPYNSAPVSAPAGNASDDDEDLKRAIQLSLEESQRARAPPQPAAVAAPPPQSGRAEEDEEDEDMKAAIAASLRDMEQSNKGKNTSGLYQTESEPEQPTKLSYDIDNSSTTVESQQQAAVKPDEFTPLEEEILHRYVRLVEDLQRAPPGTILKEAKLQQLNDSVTALRPKLARTLGSTIEKYDQLVDMHGKLTTVVRFYDKLLEERLAYAYNRHSLEPQNTSGSYGYVPVQQPMGTGGALAPVQQPMGTGGAPVQQPMGSGDAPVQQPMGTGGYPYPNQPTSPQHANAPQYANYSQPQYPQSQQPQYQNPTMQPSAPPMETQQSGSYPPHPQESSSYYPDINPQQQKPTQQQQPAPNPQKQDDAVLIEL
ncbi:vacuolar protein sorting-associated protein 27 [Trichomonascus vanleenenianus]|uniref:vacuolar protein sorting-associated protein 27 n=1 Tax=Trichomonascus vanleenenianus TaxID=2268995 RepID=UPI003ECBA015